MKSFSKMMGLVLLLSLSACAVKPVPMTNANFSASASHLISGVSRNQEPINKPIDLYEAMARAAKYNLNYRLERANTEFANTKLHLSHYSMLPKVLAKSDYAGRSNFAASRSLDLTTGLLDLNTSTSQDRNQISSDLTFSWNILDFGLSYVKAKQAADRVLISREVQRSVLHKLIEEVRATYWKAVAYKRLVAGLKKLEIRIDNALKNSRQISAGYQTSKLEALTTERELVKIKGTIKDLQTDYTNAKAQLGKLMNVPPWAHFELADIKRSQMPEHLDMPLQKMLKSAVSNRAEIRRLMYEHRINLREAEAALLDILPGLKIHGGPHTSSNSYLINENWVSWGASISWSLIKLFEYPVKVQSIEAERNLIRKKALAETMTVLTQVYVSRVHYAHMRENLKIAGDFRKVQRRLTNQLRYEVNAHQASGHELLLEQMNTLVADAKYDIAYAELQAAYANLYATIGIDPHRQVPANWSVKQVAHSMKLGWSRLKGMNPPTEIPAKVDLLHTSSTKTPEKIPFPKTNRPKRPKQQACKGIDCWKLRSKNDS